MRKNYKQGVCVLLHGKKITIRHITQVAMCITLLSVAAQIKVPILVVPFTLQVLSVFLVIYILPGQLSTLTLLLYLGLGLLGLPILASGGGIGYILQPSFGFLIGFIAASFVIKCIRKQAANTWMLTALGLVVIYCFGGTYLYVNLHYIQGLPITIASVLWMLVGFLPGDILSIVAAKYMYMKLLPPVLSSLLFVQE